MAIEISPTDVSRAEEFIAILLEENIPEGRFSKGTALRDLTVKAFSFIFAHLQKENEEVRALQSLLNVQSVATSSDPDLDLAVSASVDAILSNWFLRRKSGGFSRGQIFINVSSKQDYVIPANAKFLYSRGVAFFPDVDDTVNPILISSNDVIAVVDVNGAVDSYQFPLQVIAAQSGVGFNVPPAPWTGDGNFSIFVNEIFSDETFTGGTNRESTTAVIQRSNSAVAVRNLINNRSIDATLRERFVDINRLLVIGMGDPEMQRDLKIELGTGSRIHIGGHYDVYLELPVTQRSFEGQLGGLFQRPDRIANVFRDTTIADWTLTDVRVGDIIKVVDGLPDVPRDFTIKEIFATELRVSENNAFPLAATTITYFIYRPLFGPDFQIVPPLGTNLTGESSDLIQTAGRLLLPAGAHYDIIDVAVTDPDVGDPAINDVDEYVHFQTRVNTAPALVSASLNEVDFEYQITSSKPLTAQSQEVFEELLIDPSFEGRNVRVTYSTLSNLSLVSAFAKNRFERVLAGNILVRGFYPVSLSFTVNYALKLTATTLVDEGALKIGLVNLINTFPPTDLLDASDISTFVRNFDTAIGSVSPLLIHYALILADGRIIRFVTEDTVSVDPSKLDPEFGDDFTDPLALSVSDRTVRYLIREAAVTIQRI